VTGVVIYRPFRCCCTEDNPPGRYCGDPTCDVFWCDDCGPEFDDPCPRHLGLEMVL